MKRMLAIALAGLTGATCLAHSEAVSMKPGENWWGGMNFYGSEMPFTANTSLKMDLRKTNKSNQAASFFVSDKGRSIWCDAQATVTISGGVIRVEAAEPIEVCEAGGNLREAFQHASAKHFPPSGKTPDELFFLAPQYNTWIELTYHQNETEILAYAQSMLDNGLPPGVFMIDDTWQTGYGDWRFEPTRFKDPKGMVAKLHSMGFKVILWMCPYVGMDTPAFRRIAWGINPDSVKEWPTKGGFLMTPDGRDVQAVKWWNGYSAALDLTHPNARAWFEEQLDGLVRDFGIDGFKFDGSGVGIYANGYRAYKVNATSGEQENAYSQYALKYPVCEYRTAWRFNGVPVVERLHDKPHSWEALGKLIPDMIGGGLLGHSFMCPDMIGGGAWTAFLPGAPFDAELFIRSAQVHALCGMMQFSASPWRVLKDKREQQIIRNIVNKRQNFAKRFLKLAQECAKSGEPMIRNLEYMYPGHGYAAIRDQFMMGDFLLVAPVVTKGVVSREVVLPPGKWISDEGIEYEGNRTVTVSAPISRLPYFVPSL